MLRLPASADPFHSAAKTIPAAGDAAQRRPPARGRAGWSLSARAGPLPGSAGLTRIIRAARLPTARPPTQVSLGASRAAAWPTAGRLPDQRGGQRKPVEPHRASRRTQAHASRPDHRPCQPAGCPRRTLTRPAQAADLDALATALAGLGAQVTMYAACPAARPRRGGRGGPAAAQQAVPGRRAGAAEHRQAAETGAGGPADLATATADRAAHPGAGRPARGPLAGQTRRTWCTRIPGRPAWPRRPAAASSNLPQVQTFYSLAVQDGPGAGARRARLELALARSARAVLVGASAESSALARLGVPQAAIRVVPPGVDTSLFQPDGPAADRGDRPRLLMVVTSLAGGPRPGRRAARAGRRAGRRAVHRGRPGRGRAGR